MTPPENPPPKPHGPGQWLQSHRAQAYIGAAGLVVTIALYVRSRNSVSTSADATDSTAVPTSTADTTDSDAYNGIEDQVLGLQSALLGLSTSSASSSSSTTNMGGSGSTLQASTTPAVASAPALSYAAGTIGATENLGNLPGSSPAALPIAAADLPGNNPEALNQYETPQNQQAIGVAANYGILESLGYTPAELDNAIGGGGLSQ